MPKTTEAEPIIEPITDPLPHFIRLRDFLRQELVTDRECGEYSEALAYTLEIIRTLQLRQQRLNG
jgi:hypothetical protein